MVLPEQGSSGGLLGAPAFLEQQYRATWAEVSVRTIACAGQRTVDVP